MMNSKDGSSGEAMWQRFVNAEKQYYDARMVLVQAKRALLTSNADIASFVGDALRHPPNWGPALDLLFDADESVRRQVFPLLVDIASSTHGYIQKVRDVILSLERGWILEHLPTEIDRVLRQSATDEEYRRFAELLAMIGSPYLTRLVEQAAANADPDIREVADDYRRQL